MQIPLHENGRKIEEACPEKQGLPASLKRKSLRLALGGEFRATVLNLRRA